MRGVTCPSVAWIRDTYLSEVRYRGLRRRKILADIPACDISSAANGKRWTLEEVFMTRTRYWHQQRLTSVAGAWRTR